MIFSQANLAFRLGSVPKGDWFYIENGFQLRLLAADLS